MRTTIANLVKSLLLCSVFSLAWEGGGQIADAQSAQANELEYRFSGPYSHKNLSVYLIHGRDILATGDILTLEEGIDKKKIKVHETGSVNQLAIENLSEKMHVFVQAGDIVKGGRQDRVLSKDLFLEPRSGKVPIGSFCVEAGRWSKRGNERADAFTSSKNRINSKALKIAVQKEKAQGKVWQEVAAIQDVLSKNVGKSVRSPRSETSLELTLEDKDVNRSIEEYSSALLGILEKHDDALGYAFAVNGELNSADVYPSHQLFSKLWSKLFKASAAEALSSFEPGKKVGVPALDKAEEFVKKAEEGKEEKEISGKHTSIVSKENEAMLYYESRDDKREGTWLHRNYIKK